MMRLRFLCLCVATIALTACGRASSEANATEAVPQDTVETMTPQTAPETMTPASVRIWTVIEDKSFIKFKAKQEGVPFSGEFMAFNTEINFDAENLSASSVKVEIPLAKTEAGSKDRNATLPEKVWFSIKKYPLATFEADAFEKMEGDQFVAKGTLTIKGVSKPFSLPFSLKIDDTAVMKSSVKLNRTDWNIGESPWDTDEWISRDIELTIQVTAK